MKSIASRLAVWYALAATATLAALSVTGYYALQRSLINGLDLLNASAFGQIQARLGEDYRRLGPEAIEARIRETTEYASVLFYIDIHDGTAGTLFKSSNLHGVNIPELPGQRQYNAMVPGVGELRSGRFLLPPFDIVIGTSLKPVRDVMQGYVEISIALVTIMLFISGAIGFILSHHALRPVRIVEATASRIHSDNLSERIAVDSVDSEIVNLARLLNQMFDRLESSFRQIRRFAAEASHELKTPLSLIRLQSERLMTQGDLSPAQEDAVNAQLEEVERLNKIIEELLFISRAEAGAITLDRRPQSAARFLQTFTQDARVLCEHRGVRLVEEHEGDGEATFDARWIRQVLLNLLANALRFSPPNGIVTIRSVLGSHVWRVSVSDQGPGVPADQRARIFERFVRLATAGEQPDGGSGLGLAICRSIIELHQGRIHADAAEGASGLVVTFELPRQEPLGEGRLPSEPAAGQQDNSARHQQWHTD